MAPTKKLAELFYDLRARTEGLEKDVASAERSLGKLTTYVLANPVVALAAVATAAAGAAAAALKMASEIDGSMRRVAAAVPTGAAGIKTLTQELENLSRQSGKSQAELGRAAERIAQVGAGSAEEVAVRLRGATQASVASGLALDATIDGLDQALDLFALGAGESTAALAELFDVAKGRTSLADVFALLQGAAPSIQKLGLDLPTASRALVQLSESGLSAKKVATALKEMADNGADGRAEVERLAAEIPKAANAMADLAKASDDVAGATENAGNLLRAELNAALIDLGNILLPAALSGMEQLLRLFGRGKFDTNNITNAKVALLEFGEATQTVFTGREKGAVEAQRAVTLLAAAAREGKASFVELGEKGIGALQARVAFFQTSRFITPEQRADLKFLQQELEKAAKIGTSGALTGRAAPPTSGGTSEADRAKAGKAALDAAKEALADSIRLGEKASGELDAIIERARARRIELAQALIATGRATADTLRQLLEDTEAQLRDSGFTREQARIIADAKLGLKSIAIDLDLATQGLAKLADLRRGEDAKTQQRAGEQARLEEDAKNRALRAGRAIEDIGGAVLAAASAFGVLEDAAAKALEAVIDVGAGIARIFAGDVKGGGLQLAKGAVNLASQAFGKDPAAEQRRREHVENLQALKAIEQHTGDLVGLQASGSFIGALKDGIAGLLSRTGDAGGFRRFGDAGPLRGINEADVLEGATGRSFKEIEALAKSLGITLNGTKESYVLFLDALKKLDLQAFGKGFAGQIRKLEIDARLDPKAFEGIEGVIKRLQVLAGPDGAPAIANAIAGLDVSTAEGKAKAIASLGDVLKNIAALDVKDLGGLSLDQFIQEILDAIDALRKTLPDAGEAFSRAMELLGLQVEFGTLDAKGKLDKAFAAFTKAFPDLSALVDTSSIAAFRKSIGSIIDGFAADGELSDAERAQIEVLRALLAAFEQATPAVEEYADALSVLSDRFVLFGTAAVDQIRQILETVTSDDSIGKNAGLALLKGLTEGLDLATEAGQSELRARAQRIFEALAEGGITAEEQVVIDMLKRILGIAGDAAKTAADIAADAARELKDRVDAARKLTSDLADAAIALGDITDPLAILQIRIRALGASFPELAALFAQFDLATEAGRAAFEEWIRSLVAQPEKLKGMADALGLTVDELLAILLGLESGIDAVGAAVQSVVDQINDALGALDVELAIEGITDPIEKLRRAVETIGGLSPEIAAALKGIDLTTEAGRAAAEKALQSLAAGSSDASFKRLVLDILTQIRGIPRDGATGDTGAGAGASSRESTANLASAASVTEVTANRWLDVMTTDLALSRTRNVLLEQIFSSITRAPLALPPALAFSSIAGGGAVVSGPTFNIALSVTFTGPVTTTGTEALGSDLSRSIYRMVREQLATDLLNAERARGRAKA